jgi:hypothetical protein
LLQLYQQPFETDRSGCCPNPVPFATGCQIENGPYTPT